MTSLAPLLVLAHLIGLALAVGCATAKLMLLIRGTVNQAFMPAFAAVSRPVTRLIVVGLALLTLSGVGWLLVGYPFRPLLIVKLALVGAIWLLGPIIDKVVEPRFQALAASPGAADSAAFVRSRRQYLMVEAAATGLFYVIVVMWVLR